MSSFATSFEEYLEDLQDFDASRYDFNLEITPVERPKAWFGGNEQYGNHPLEGSLEPAEPKFEPFENGMGRIPQVAESPCESAGLVHESFPDVESSKLSEDPTRSLSTLSFSFVSPSSDSEDSRQSPERVMSRSSTRQSLFRRQRVSNRVPTVAPLAMLPRLEERTMPMPMRPIKRRPLRRNERPRPRKLVFDQVVKEKDRSTDRSLHRAPQTPSLVSTSFSKELRKPGPPSVESPARTSAPQEPQEQIAPIAPSAESPVRTCVPQDPKEHRAPSMESPGHSPLPLEPHKLLAPGAESPFPLSAEGRPVVYPLKGQAVCDPLPADYESIVDGLIRKANELVSKGERDRIMIRHPVTLDIMHACDVVRFGTQTYLSDLPITYICHLINERSKKHQDLPRVHCQTTFFYMQVLKEKSARILQRWGTLKNLDFCSLDIFLFPVYIDKGESFQHYVACAIYIHSKIIVLYDSLCALVSHDYNIFQTILGFLEVVSKVRKGTGEGKEFPFNSSEWRTLRETSLVVPQQINGVDCGLYTVLCLNYISLAWMLDFFDPKLFPLFRKVCLHAIATDDLQFLCVGPKATATYTARLRGKGKGKVVKRKESRRRARKVQSPSAESPIRSEHYKNSSLSGASPKLELLSSQPVKQIINTGNDCFIICVTHLIASLPVPKLHESHHLCAFCATVMDYTAVGQSKALITLLVTSGSLHQQWEQGSSNAIALIGTDERLAQGDPSEVLTNAFDAEAVCQSHKDFVNKSQYKVYVNRECSHCKAAKVNNRLEHLLILSEPKTSLRDIFVPSVERVEECTCDACGRKCSAKQTETYDLSHTEWFIVVVKRTVYDKGTRRAMRVNARINVPATLTAAGGVFRFQAAAMHRGRGHRSGHFVCLRRCVDGYVLVDDANITKASFESLEGSKVFLVAYSKPFQQGERLNPRGVIPDVGTVSHENSLNALGGPESGIHEEGKSHRGVFPEAGIVSHENSPNAFDDLDSGIHEKGKSHIGVIPEDRTFSRENMTPNEVNEVGGLGSDDQLLKTYSPGLNGSTGKSPVGVSPNENAPGADANVAHKSPKGVIPEPGTVFADDGQGELPSDNTAGEEIMYAKDASERNEPADQEEQKTSTPSESLSSFISDDVVTRIADVDSIENFLIDDLEEIKSFFNSDKVLEFDDIRDDENVRQEMGLPKMTFDLDGFSVQFAELTQMNLPMMTSLMRSQKFIMYGKPSMFRDIMGANPDTFSSNFNGPHLTFMVGELATMNVGIVLMLRRRLEPSYIQAAKQRCSEMIDRCALYAFQMASKGPGPKTEETASSIRTKNELGYLVGQEALRHFQEKLDEEYEAFPNYAPVEPPIFFASIFGMKTELYTCDAPIDFMFPDPEIPQHTPKKPRVESPGHQSTSSGGTHVRTPVPASPVKTPVHDFPVPRYRCRVGADPESSSQTSSSDEQDLDDDFLLTSEDDEDAVGGAGTFSSSADDDNLVDNGYFDARNASPSNGGDNANTVAEDNTPLALNETPSNGGDNALGDNDENFNSEFWDNIGSPSEDDDVEAEVGVGKGQGCTTHNHIWTYVHLKLRQALTKELLNLLKLFTGTVSVSVAIATVIGYDNYKTPITLLSKSCNTSIARQHVGQQTFDCELPAYDIHLVRSGALRKCVSCVGPLCHTVGGVDDKTEIEIKNTSSSSGNNDVTMTHEKLYNGILKRAFSQRGQTIIEINKLTADMYVQQTTGRTIPKSGVSAAEKRFYKLFMKSRDATRHCRQSANYGVRREFDFTMENLDLGFNSARTHVNSLGGKITTIIKFLTMALMDSDMECVAVQTQRIHALIGMYVQYIASYAIFIIRRQFTINTCGDNALGDSTRKANELGNRLFLPSYVLDILAMLETMLLYMFKGTLLTQMFAKVRAKEMFNRFQILEGIQSFNRPILSTKLWDFEQCMPRPTSAVMGCIAEGFFFEHLNMKRVVAHILETKYASWCRKRTMKVVANAEHALQNIITFRNLKSVLYCPYVVGEIV
eukprot:Nk52_evm2s395 gene=Nk52_evmTU2s395